MGRGGNGPPRRQALTRRAHGRGSATLAASTLISQHSQADHSPGIAAMQRRSLQAALDAQSYDATMGLGLMLADVVARAHGGRRVLPEAAGETGLVAELELSVGSTR